MLTGGTGYKDTGAGMEYIGGGSGIRTHDALRRITVFKTVAFVHSAIPPLMDDAIPIASPATSQA